MPVRSPNAPDIPEPHDSRKLAPADSLVSPAGVNLNDSEFGLQARMILWESRIADSTSTPTSLSHNAEADILFDLANFHDTICEIADEGKRIETIEPFASSIEQEAQANYLALRRYHAELADAAEKVETTRRELASRKLRPDSGLDDLAAIREQHRLAAQCYSHALIAGVFSLEHKFSDLDDAELIGFLLTIYQRHAESIARQIAQQIESLPRPLARIVSSHRIRVAQQMDTWKNDYRRSAPTVLTERSDGVPLREQ